jgi:recombination protein RecA
MNETMSSVLKDIYKKYDLRVGSLSSVAEDTQVLSTGNLAIDYITGVGGLPLGRSVELYGLSGSGKSTLALQTAASLQQRIIAENRDEFIVYADYEHALDRVYAVALGLDVDHESFLLMQPDTFEQGVSAVLLLLATNKVRLSIWDSVAAMIPDAAIEDTDSKDGFMDRPMDSARKAKLMSGFLRLLNPRLHRFSCTAIFLNHLMDVIDTTPGFKAFKRTTTPGGRALKFYASMRIEFTQIGTVKGKVFDALANAEVEKVETTAVKAKVTKNKVGSPFRECDIKVRLGKGFDNFWSAIQVLIAYKAIEMT